MRQARKLPSWTETQPLPKIFRKGRCLLDCGGFPHLKFLDHAKSAGGMRILVFNPHRKMSGLEQINSETLDDYSRSTAHVPFFDEESVYFLLDDLGVLFFSQDPLSILSGMYSLLEKDGWAWIRVPDTFWVHLENGHRVAFKEFLVQKMPDIFRSIYSHQIPETLREQLSSTSGLVQMRRSSRLERLVLPLGIRTIGKPLTWDMAQPLSFVVEMVEKNP